MAATILFKEQQKFRQWWIWALLTPILLIVGLASFFALKESTDNWPILFLLVPLFCCTLAFYWLRLDMEVRADGIYVRFFPVQKQFRSYHWNNIDQLFIRQYQPVKEYGGWGIRGLDRNRALNVSGTQGLQLVLQDGKRLLIGTQRPEDLKAIIASIPTAQYLILNSRL